MGEMPPNRVNRRLAKVRQRRPAAANSSNRPGAIAAVPERGDGPVPHGREPG